MKALIVLFISLIIIGFSSAETGFIEISGDPGFSVVLGDEPKGVTGEKPLMLSGIKVGRHKLAFLKQGYHRVDNDVEVSVNSVTQISMVANDPEFNIAMSQATEFSSQRKVGSMDITTWPTHCNLEITGEQWTANSDFYKETSIIRLNNLPEGVYKIVATAEGIQAQGELEVVDEEQSACFINLFESQFIDLNKKTTKVEQAERMAERAVDAANKAKEERLATEKATRSSKEENDKLRQELERLKARAESEARGDESRDRKEEVSIEDWVSVYVATMESNVLANHEELWADFSDYQYFKGGLAQRHQVITSIQQNIKKWPTRRTSLVKGSLTGKNDGDTAVISFQMDYTYAGTKGNTTSGSSNHDMTIKKVGKTYQIIKWRERVAR